MGLFIPSGFAHAYYSYEKENVIYYKLDNYYSPRFESGIFYNDKNKSQMAKKKNAYLKKNENLNLLRNLKENIKVFNQV